MAVPVIANNKYKGYYARYYY